MALSFRHRAGQWEAPEPADRSQAALTVEGDDSSVLLFALGRIGPDDRRLTLSGDTTLAGRFKSWLPGP